MKSYFSFPALMLAASAICLPNLAQAQFAKPEDAVKYRKAAFTVMGTHFGRIGAMANGRIPFNAQAAANSMAVVETVSKLPWEAFAANTENVGDTRALPAVWKEADKFKGAGDKMHAELGKLSLAVKTGNLDQIKAAFGPVGASCKACHDNFKKE
jgi:cytochrome c556